MLSEANVHAVVAVTDLARAKEFYEGTLGLEVAREDPGGVTYQSGESKLFVYESEHAGTNQATAASWEVSDLGDVVDRLKESDISFEHYDMEGVTREGDIHVMGDVRVAWFKDPDGNTLCVGNAL